MELINLNLKYLISIITNVLLFILLNYIKKFYNNLLLSKPFTNLYFVISIPNRLKQTLVFLRLKLWQVDFMNIVFNVYFFFIIRSNKIIFSLDQETSNENFIYKILSYFFFIVYSGI